MIPWFLRDFSSVNSYVQLRLLAVFINSQDKGQILDQTKWRELFVNLRLYMFGYLVKNINYFYKPDSWSKQFDSV